MLHYFSIQNLIPLYDQIVKCLIFYFLSSWTSLISMQLFCALYLYTSDIFFRLAILLQWK